MRRSLRSWLWRVPVELEVDEEIAFHLEMRTRELIARGVPPREARDLVLSRLGDLRRLKRTCVDLGRKRDREMRLTQWIDSAVTDVRFALRQLRAAPGFTLVAALTLALGIGANSAMFALADSALLRPLPFDDPDQVVMVWEQRPNAFRTMPSPAEFRAWSAQSRAFDAVAGLAAGGNMTLAGADGTVEQIPSQTVSVRYFDVLRVRLIAGRTFVAADLTPAPNAIVVSEGLWRRRFAGDPSLVGRDLVLGGRPFTVVGIVPGTFQMVPPMMAGGVATGAPVGIWSLAGFVGPGAAENAHYVHVVARLRSGVGLQAAQDEMRGIAARMAVESPSNRGHCVALEPLRDALIGREVRLTATVLLGVVGFVLLMCCANVANLMLARTGTRARELAVRSALGAGRARIAGQLITESLVLGALGGLLGVGTGMAILRIVPALIPPGLLPNAVALSFDGRVLAFSAAAALVVGLLFGLAPSWQSTGASLARAAGSSGRATRQGRRLRTALVVGEVAAAVLVLSGAGLLLRTWVALGNVDPGHRAGERLTMTVQLPFPSGPGSRYATSEALRAYYDAAAREVAGLPGVRRVAWGSALPLDGWWFGQTFAIAGDPPRADGVMPGAAYQMVSDTYFDTMAIPLVAGRAFTADDRVGGVPVCIVSEAFVRQFLEGREPVGTRVIVPTMAFGPPQRVERVIVGVSRQVKGTPDEPDPRPQIYVPMAQNVWWSASLVVEPTAGRAEALTSAVQAAVRRVDGERPPGVVRTLETIAWNATSRPRFRAVLVATFAGVALALALVGVFGVLAYSVQQRTREFGVRIALGAGASDVLRLVLAGAARVVLAGVALGLAGAAAMSRSLSTLLFDVKPLDPLTFTSAAVVLAATALLAAAAPAFRASRVDPVVTFRSE